MTDLIVMMYERHWDLGAEVMLNGNQTTPLEIIDMSAFAKREGAYWDSMEARQECEKIEEAKHAAQLADMYQTQTFQSNMEDAMNYEFNSHYDGVSEAYAETVNSMKDEGDYEEEDE